jgi:hypothetical protein
MERGSRLAMSGRSCFLTLIVGRVVESQRKVFNVQAEQRLLEYLDFRLSLEAAGQLCPHHQFKAFLHARAAAYQTFAMAQLDSKHTFTPCPKPPTSSYSNLEQMTQQ